VGHFLCGRPNSTPTPAHLRTRIGQAARYRAAVADRRGPPVRPSPPNPPLLQRHTSSPTSSPSLSHPRVDSFSPHCLHPCASTLEPSRRRSCSVESYRRYRMRPTLLHAVPPGCWCQPLDDESSSRLLC
jgi:hypothetical protein